MTLNNFLRLTKEEKQQRKKKQDDYIQALWESLSPFEQIHFGSINEMLYEMFYKDME